MRFSTWTFPDLSYVSFLSVGTDVWVEIAGRLVLFLFTSRGRVRSACFPYQLTPYELRKTVATLREAGNGLERWIVPALEFTPLASAFYEDNPEANAIVPELLASCQDLPVAEQWTRVREIVFANEAKARAKQERARERAAKKAAARNPPKRPRVKRRSS
jgi:hypothetical protein